jgi:hypothetical protein
MQSTSACVGAQNNVFNPDRMNEKKVKEDLEDSHKTKWLGHGD